MLTVHGVVGFRHHQNHHWMILIGCFDELNVAKGYVMPPHSKLEYLIIDMKNVT